MQEQSTQSKYIRRSYHGRARHWQFLLVFMALLCLIVSPIYAASFDCSKAATEMEKTICSDPKLSSLDEDLAKIYGEIKSQLKGDADALSQLTKSQREWLAGLTQNKDGNIACAADKECLTISYQKRIKELQDKLSLELKKAPSASGEVKKYPPYPDVWEREFVNYISDMLHFYPVENGDVLVEQFIKVDRNGEVIRDREGGFTQVQYNLLFFGGETVRESDRKRIKVEDISRKTRENIYSCGSSSGLTGFSDFISLKDGGMIRWINGMVTDGDEGSLFGPYQAADNYKRVEIDGVLLYQSELRNDYTAHVCYHNSFIVLAKVDKGGKVLWQKLYLYFHPWWQYDVWIYDRIEGDYEDIYSFYYFKKGCLVTIDEDRMFVYFDGTKKIFRIDQEGNPRTDDKNLIVIDYTHYKGFVQGIIHNIYGFKKRSPQVSINSCGIAESKKGKDPKSIKTNIGDYDYIGEQLCKKLGLPYQADFVKKMIAKHKRLEECIQNYRKMEESN